MTGTGNVPIIFLAFAKQDDSIDRDDLRYLPDEIHGIRDALKGVEKEGLCKVIEKTYATTEIIFDVFQEHANCIALFHFGGHADRYNLLLQDYYAHKDGLVPFLAGQTNLSLVFLNGCSTGDQAHELVQAGIPAVIGTDSSILDQVAVDLALRFYKGIAEGLTLERSWSDAENFVKTRGSGLAERNFRRRELVRDGEDPDGFPWQVRYNETVPNASQWKLFPRVKTLVLSEAQMQAVTDIKALVKKKVHSILKKPRLSGLRKELVDVLEIDSGVDNVKPIVDRLLEMELVPAIQKLQEAAQECIEMMEHDGTGRDWIDRIREYCVSILGWMVLTSIKDQWASNAALEMARKGTAMGLLLPVKTEMGTDIAVCRLSALKPNLDLDESRNVKSGTRIPIENWEPEGGWLKENRVLQFKKTLWRYLVRGGDSPPSGKDLDEEINVILDSRKEVDKEKYYAVPNITGKMCAFWDDALCKELGRDISKLDVFYLSSEGGEILAIDAEHRLKAQIREFLLIKTTIQ